MSVANRISDQLFATLMGFLAPLFATGHAGLALAAETADARAAELVNGFGARSAWDVFGVARIVSLGVASMASVELSMRADLPAPLVVRCRSNANALQRTADRAETQLRRRGAEADGAAAGPVPADEAIVLAALESAADAHLRRARAGVLERREAREQAGTEGSAHGPAQVPAGDADGPDAVPTLVTDAIARAVPVRQPEDRIAWANGIAMVMDDVMRDVAQAPEQERREQLACLDALRQATGGRRAGPAMDGMARASVSATALMSLPVPPGIVPPWCQA